MNASEYESAIKLIANKAANLINSEMEVLTDNPNSSEGMSFEDGVSVGVSTTCIAIILDMLENI